MADWKKIGVSVAVGAVAGGVDQWIQNADEKRGIDARAAGKITATQKLPVMKQFGTYYNYGVPILAILATAMNWVKGDMATSLVTAGAQLAGRKAVHTFTTGAGSNVPSAAYTEFARQSAARSAAAMAAARAAGANPATRTYEEEFSGAGVL